jgi:hypothetical protein
MDNHFIRAMPTAPALALRVGPIFVVPPLRASIRIAVLS